MFSIFYRNIFATISCQYIVKKIMKEDQVWKLNWIEFLLPYTGSAKVLENIPA